MRLTRTKLGQRNDLSGNITFLDVGVDVRPIAYRYADVVPSLMSARVPRVALNSQRNHYVGRQLTPLSMTTWQRGLMINPRHQGRIVASARQFATVSAAPYSKLHPDHNGWYARLHHGLHRSVILPTVQRRSAANKPYTESTQSPLAGLWKPTHLQRLYYGSGSVAKHLLDCLPSGSSRAFIITGSSLANKTQLIKQVEELLGSKHAGTFSKIGQHAPVKELDEATELVLEDDKIDTIISVGGGSPIDSAKAISYRLNGKAKGKFLHHIAIPTTLSAAECTLGAGYTNADGMKTGVADPELAPHAILYDSKFALDTPPWLFKSTGMRAMDHAMEIMYHPTVLMS